MATLSGHGLGRGLSLLRRIRRRIERSVRAARDARSADPATRIGGTGSFTAGDVDFIRDAYFQPGMAAGPRWQPLRDAHMKLPDWFRHDLDPLGADYAEQQHRLWQALSGVQQRHYEPALDEKEHDWGPVDPVRLPGFFVRRDVLAVASAADHIIASGMLLKHSGVKPGDWALEYGAGFGHTALTLARLGVQVDAVDISAMFCGFVRRQAEFFQVPLTAFEGPFGWAPRPGRRYALIWFYESFHHCLDFQQVVRQLHEQLAPGGRIVLGGEPIEYRQNAAVPYPWGVRLHSEVAAAVRQHHWFELGFTEDFLFELFSSAGFIGWRVDCEPSLFGRLHVFERRSDELHLGRLWLPTVLAERWNAPQEDGRFAGDEAQLPLDAGSDVGAIEIDVANPHRHPLQLHVQCGAQHQQRELAAGERATLRFESPPPAAGRRLLVVRSRATGLRRLAAWRGGAAGRGVFIRRIRYRPTAGAPPTRTL